MNSEPHICTKCHVTVITGSKSWCKPCNAAAAKALRQRRRELGLCSGCGTFKGDKSLCDQCLDKATQAQHRHRNTQARKEYIREFYKTEHGKKLNRQKHGRRQKSVQYRLANTLRARLRGALSGRIKAGSAVRDLGCSVDQLVKHLESQFVPGMSWDNYGNTLDSWSIDHIIPMYSVNLSEPSNQQKVCHYTNLRPLWHRDNIHRYSEERKLAA